MVPTARPRPGKARNVRFAPDHAAQQPVARSAQTSVAEHHRRAAGADGERSEGRLDVLARKLEAAFRWSIVDSTSDRPLSVPTMTPAAIWPNSIMLATWTTPLSSPRQALLTS